MSDTKPTYEELVEALQKLRDRFHKACTAGGSDRDYADIACAETDSLLTRCRQGGEKNG